MKYLKPRSLTFWSAMLPLLAGLALATEPLHGQTAITDTLRGLFGPAEPWVLINAGLAGIGIRAALP